MRRANLLCITFFIAPITIQFAHAGEPKILSHDLLKDGWISLFDGETLFGWEPVDDAKWEVKNGEIRTTGEKPGWLMTTTRWGDYTLYGEFRAAAATNSGVFLRTPLHPKDPSADCYEWSIAPDDNPFPTGSFVARQKAIIRSTNDIGSDRWLSFKITVHNNYLVAAVLRSATEMTEPFRTVDYVDSKSIRIDRIGLQSNKGPVAFRKLMLRPFVGDQVFNGKGLNGWSTRAAERCKFDVTKNGELHVTNGPGQLETNKDFANFVLQLECKVNGDGLNSGVFFRTLRAGRWAGYESQIQNSFVGGDRAKPKDFGTGGIYRRQPARYVVPNDRDWFTKTIVADGPHMAVWVNGYQVSDWIDVWPEKENAREGKRVGGGAIALQGHDATTDLLFRNIRAAELPR
jgi:hypothetical protein